MKLNVTHNVNMHQVSYFVLLQSYFPMKMLWGIYWEYFVENRLYFMYSQQHITSCCPPCPFLSPAPADRSCRCITNISVTYKYQQWHAWWGRNDRAHFLPMTKQSLTPKKKWCLLLLTETLLSNHFLSQSLPDSKVHGANMGPVGPRWAPCWPHEPCYQACILSKAQQYLSWTLRNMFYLNGRARAQLSEKTLQCLFLSTMSV